MFSDRFSAMEDEAVVYVSSMAKAQHGIAMTMFATRWNGSRNAVSSLYHHWWTAARVGLKWSSEILEMWGRGYIYVIPDSAYETQRGRRCADA